jgi:hypothetical protein
VNKTMTECDPSLRNDGGNGDRNANRLGPGIGRLAAGLSLLGALLATLPAPGAATPDPAAPPDNRACLRCHAMTTLAYRDPATGAIVDLAVDPRRLAGSVHGTLACSECHDPGYRDYPHPRALAAKLPDCVSCHQQRKYDQPPDQAAKEERYRFGTIDTEYRQSIHATSTDPAARGFSCHSCHDPHGFKVSRPGRPIPEVVRDDNRVCRRCHEAPDRPPLAAHHAWLPQPERHWQEVRCLDCHTPLRADEGPVSHEVRKAAQANRDCLGCHSRESRLLERLYRYRSGEDLATRGWVNLAVFNEAYVVGMSRSDTLDRLGLGVLGLAILGLAGHAFGRYQAYRRTRENRS